MTLMDDPISQEVFRHEVTSVAEEMGIAMRRTVRSIGAREGGDFSTALLDRTGRVIAQGIANGAHLGYLKSLMPTVLAKFRDDIHDGDVIASNDPYAGMSHLPDIAVVIPVFVDGSLQAFTASVCHHSDVGGRTPGGMGVEARELFEEGVRLPTVKLAERGRMVQGILDVLIGNCRWPEEVTGDLEAQVTACQRGAVVLADTIRKYGGAPFHELVEGLCRRSEAVMRSAIAALPDGVYGVADDFEIDLDRGESVHLQITLTIDGDSAIVDFKGSGRQLPNAANCPFGITQALVYVAFRSIAGSDVPVSDGLTAPIDIRLPEGTVVNPAFPGAVGGRSMLLWRVMDLVYEALAEAAPDRLFAGGDGGISAIVYTPTERTAARGLLFDFFSGGWGARSTSDGIDGVSSLLMGGTQRSAPAELIEREFPVVLEGFGFVPDTAGPGKYRGCVSVFRRWRFLESGHVYVRQNRLARGPRGLAGGAPGRAGSVTLERNGESVPLPRHVTIGIDVEPGDRLTQVLPSGGGYGHPEERDPAAVREDVLDEKYTAVEAQRVYGTRVEA